MTLISVFRGIGCAGLAGALPVTLLAASGGLSKQKIDFEGKRHDYFVFVPDTVSNGAPAPLLVLLHGSGHDGRSLLDPWKKFAAKEGIILLAPNAENPVAWQSPADGPGALIAIADFVKKQQGADPNRIYLFGHSAGAVFALLMSLWEPQYFAGVAVHAGAAPPGNGEQVVGAAQAARRKTPIQIQVGNRVPFFPVQAVRATQALFDKGGFAVEVLEIPGHDHNYYSSSDRINRVAWDFLKDKTLSAGPR